MLPILLLFVSIFTPQADSIPYRQPQLAAKGENTVLTFGAGSKVYFSSSPDMGATWTTPMVIADQGKLALGMRRGPRVVISEKAIVVSAIVGEKGGGQDGDLVTWRSTDNGKTWSSGHRRNDTPGSAREGLHAMASGGANSIFLTWLDLREKGTKVYGTSSADGGETWSANNIVYASPSGSVCQCCHPSVFVDAQNRIFVMFRNWLDGFRDMYVVRSDDGGRSFSPVKQLGSGSWKLNACPMDGGSFVVEKGGDLVAVWRREDTVYRSGVGGAEAALGHGKHPVVVSTSRGIVVAWTEGKTMKWSREGRPEIQTLEGDASFLSLAALPNGDVLVAGEREGSVFVDRLK